MAEKVYGNRPPSLNVRYVIKKPQEKAESQGISERDVYTPEIKAKIL
jgi:hypothetical protein